MINLPDAVGFAVPAEYGALLADVRARCPVLDAAVVSAHCHNDLGLAVANSLAGVLGGARQIECAVNGLGERAGNAALEEVVTALEAHRDAFGVRTGIDASELGAVSRLVGELTGYPLSPHKPVLGANVAV